jgi:hypothetical protein
MNYQDDVKYPETCKIAAAGGIVVNTIQCGGHGRTKPIWQEIAAKAEGRYFRVEQSGGAVLASTPFDAELARISADLEATRLYYGTVTERAAQDRRLDAAEEIRDRAPAAARAQRAIFNAGTAGRENFLGEQELVSAVAEEQVDLSSIKEEHLPEPLRGMSLQKRADYLKQQAVQREKFREQIDDLAAKRDAYIKKELAKAGQAEDEGFDAAIFACVKDQAAKAGIRLGGGLSH